MLYTNTYTDTKTDTGKYMYKFRRTQIHRQLRCSGTNVLSLTSWIRFFDKRIETILKSLSYHTMLTTPQLSAHFQVQSQFLNTMVGTQHYGSELHSLSQLQKLNCLPAWSTVNSQLTLFQNLQIPRTIASGRDVIHVFVWHYELDICTYMYTHVCVCTHTSVRVCVCIYVYVCVRPRPHSPACMHVHAHIYTHIYVARWVRFGLGIEFQMLGKPIN